MNSIINILRGKGLFSLCNEIQENINALEVKNKELEALNAALTERNKLLLIRNESMEKEIHRMALRLDALKREQERLSIEMENAILKRSTDASASLPPRFPTR
jgi:DNA repair exonuclease SbcCD ATPase subunit